HCQRQLSLTEPLAHLKPGVWHTVEVALDCAETSTAKRISDALLLSSSGQHSLAVADLVLLAQKIPMGAAQSEAALSEAKKGSVQIGCSN
ncbi:MAG: hypothetical protein KKB45_04505, partial [Gammaproteobacteria bacterium]|nr:hypothetical protein [Gammaproteobacteria bacterium]